MAGPGVHAGEQIIRPPRRILVAPDSFKGTLSAAEAAAAMERGILATVPDATVLRHPVSDGGEGLLDVLLPPGGTIVSTRVQGPLPGQRVEARWGITAEGGGVIEMAEAAGLSLVPPDRRDPRLTTTHGVGELILAALDRGVRKLIIGIGGSSTNDGGSGMASALGAEFLDASGHPLPPGGSALARLARIEITRLDARLAQTTMTVACDVVSLLTGPAGASSLYAPQKGATPEMVALLDAALRQYASILGRRFGRDVGMTPGSGAAGGLGAGLLAFCNATLVPGIEVVLDATGFDAALARVDLVITGEGRIDAQTREGKALAGVLRHARRAGVPVAAVVGSATGDSAEFTGPDGFIGLATIVNEGTPPDRAMREASSLLAERTAELLSRLMKGIR